VSELTNDVVKAERAAKAAKEEAAKARDEVGQLGAKMTTMVTMTSQTVTSRTTGGGSGGGGGDGDSGMTVAERELLVGLRDRVIKIEEDGRTHAGQHTAEKEKYNEDQQALWEAINSKASLKVTEKTFATIEPKVERLRGDLDRLSKAHEELREVVATKADAVVVAGKADKEELLDKATKSSVAAVDKKTVTLKNDIALTAQMMDNLRKVVEDASEDGKKVHRLIDGFDKAMSLKAELSYVDRLGDELDKKFRLNATGIRELCRTKADYVDVTNLESQVLGLIKGEEAFIAAGRMHFRCLSCDRFGHAVAGPGTVAYEVSTGLTPLQAGAVNTGPHEPIPLYGHDGKVYHGAVPSFDIHGAPSGEGLSGVTATAPRTESTMMNSTSRRPNTASSFNNRLDRSDRTLISLSPHPPQSQQPQQQNGPPSTTTHPSKIVMPPTPTWVP
jgi:hypothetical protein